MNLPPKDLTHEGQAWNPDYSFSEVQDWLRSTGFRKANTHMTVRRDDPEDNDDLTASVDQTVWQCWKNGDVEVAICKFTTQFIAFQGESESPYTILQTNDDAIFEAFEKRFTRVATPLENDFLFYARMMAATPSDDDTLVHGFRHYLARVAHAVGMVVIETPEQWLVIREPTRALLEEYPDLTEFFAEMEIEFESHCTDGPDWWSEAA
ncbi:hypothetical protein [Brevundimonas sp. NPDC058933]|uniref:hypothetical protein n=1 Tax=Brevundimonas sp. NPDC058933 TaxID=3346673 RepID=UPI003BEF291B